MKMKNSSKDREDQTQTRTFALKFDDIKVDILNFEGKLDPNEFLE